MKKHQFIIDKETYCIHCGLVIDDWMIKDSIETRNLRRLVYCDADENNKV